MVLNSMHKFQFYECNTSCEESLSRLTFCRKSFQLLRLLKQKYFRLDKNRGEKIVIYKQMNINVFRKTKLN